MRWLLGYSEASRISPTSLLSHRARSPVRRRLRLQLSAHPWALSLLLVREGTKKSGSPNITCGKPSPPRSKARSAVLVEMSSAVPKPVVLRVREGKAGSNSFVLGVDGCVKKICMFSCNLLHIKADNTDRGRTIVQKAWGICLKIILRRIILKGLNHCLDPKKFWKHRCRVWCAQFRCVERKM